MFSKIPPRQNLKMLQRPFWLKVLNQKLLKNSNFSTSSVLLKNHYDSLGITPQATQADIKTAYYKLSMLYHPDKNKGSDVASRKFQDISAAYEVLGNFKMRRLYDKGILHTLGGQYAEAVEEEHPEANFYKSRQTRHTAPPMSGRTPIYDFDEWSRQHYGTTFERAARARMRYREKKFNIERDRNDIQNETVIGGWMIMFCVFLIISYYNRSDFDDVNNSNREVKNLE